MQASANSGRPSELEEQARRAAQKGIAGAQKAAAELQDSAQRTWRKLDAEYALTEKAQKTARRLEEQAREVDQTWNVRRRLRSSVDHAQRMWPVWSRNLDAFSATWYGKSTILFVLLAVLSSSWFWKLFNLILILWWLAIPLAAMVVGSAQRQATERAAAAEAQEQQRRQNPFANMFRQRGPGSSRAGPVGPQSGPVIDADYVVLSDDDVRKK